MKPNRIKKQKCYDHPHDRDISEYVFWHTDIRWKNPVDVYQCRLCKERHERILADEERAEAHNKKQRDEAWERYEKKRTKIRERHERSLKEGLWDFQVQNELARGLKLRGQLRYKYKEMIPVEVLQLARATMKLNKAIEKTKRGEFTRKQIEEAKAAAIEAEKNKPILKCFLHGERFSNDVIKSGFDNRNGKQRYKCRDCMKVLHAKNYQNNKDRLREVHRKYKALKRLSRRNSNDKNNEHETTAQQSTSSH